MALKTFLICIILCSLGQILKEVTIVQQLFCCCCHFHFKHALTLDLFSFSLILAMTKYMISTTCCLKYGILEPQSFHSSVFKWTIER